MNDYAEIGQRPIRHDGFEKVTGKAQFGADVTLPGTLCGEVLRSSHAHARIKTIDTSKAMAVDGVFAVVTAADFPRLPFGGQGSIARDNLAHEKVLYHGHAVAAVAASNRAIAQAAAELIEVDYEPLPPVMNLDDALKGDVLLHEEFEDNGRLSNVYERAVNETGDVEAGFAEADVIIERAFTTPTIHQGYIEPSACLVSYDEGAQSTVWTTTQGHFNIRDNLAVMMDMGVDELNVIPTEIGGGFGGKTAVYLEGMALMLSKLSGRPVKMRMTREDVFRSAGPGAASKSTVKIGAKRDGTITAMQASLAYESGAFPGAPLGGGMRCVFSSYDVPNVKIEGLAAVVNKPKVRAYRGPGAPQATFAAESVMNELAHALGMDPIEFRLKNALRSGGSNIIGEFREIGLVECLEAARASAHYRTPLGKHQGRAAAVGFWRNGGGTSSASIVMNGNGSASVLTGSADLSGTRISLAMIAAETLGVSINDVRAEIPDTNGIGHTDGAGGSRTINATGQAVTRAAHEVIRQFKERAASGWNVTPEQVEWRDGKAINTTREEELTIKEICLDAPATGGPIAGSASLRAESGLGPCFSVHLCDVEVDPDTGKTTVLRYTAVQDAGCAIHPSYVEGQFQGGAVQGIGWALNEEFMYDEDGALENPGFLDYRVPVASDLPMIDTIIVEVPNTMHPFGVRGVGEAPIIPPLAAVASAVSNAIGVRMTELPLSPPKVLEAMENA